MNEILPLENLAPNSKRVWSFTIDGMLTNLLYIAIVYDQIVLLKTPEEIIAFARGTSWMLALINIFYHTFFTWQSGKTLGKHIMKIKVVTIGDGTLLSFSASLLRALVRVVDEALFYIGFLPAFFSPTRQTLHDRVSRSVVVNV
jgi:uncharacterized RDD family membrane protein YckC